MIKNNKRKKQINFAPSIIKKDVLRGQTQAYTLKSIKKKVCSKAHMQSRIIHHLKFTVL